MTITPKDSHFDFGDLDPFGDSKQQFEDGTNIAFGTPFREEFTTRVLPWYIPSEAKASHNWREDLAKLRTRFDNFIDEHCATECFLVQTLIPQIGEVPMKLPGNLPDRELLCSGPGLRREPARLFGVQKPLAAQFPIMNVREEPFLEPDGKPTPFRLGLNRYISVFAIPDGLRPLPIPKLTELLGDGKNLLKLQLKSGGIGRLAFPNEMRNRFGWMRCSRCPGSANAEDHSTPSVMLGLTMHLSVFLEKGCFHACLASLPRRRENLPHTKMAIPERSTPKYQTSRGPPSPPLMKS